MKDWIASAVWFVVLDVILAVAGVYSTETALAAWVGAALALGWVYAVGGGPALRRGLPAAQLAPWLPPVSGVPETPVEDSEPSPAPVITPQIVRRAKIFKWTVRVLAIPFLPMIGTRKLLDKIA